jgi:hypothetical protein
VSRAPGLMPRIHSRHFLRQRRMIPCPSRRALKTLRGIPKTLQIFKQVLDLNEIFRM